MPNAATGPLPRLAEALRPASPGHPSDLRALAGFAPGIGRHLKSAAQDGFSRLAVKSIHMMKDPNKRGCEGRVFSITQLLEQLRRPSKTPEFTLRVALRHDEVHMQYSAP